MTNLVSQSLLTQFEITNFTLIKKSRRSWSRVFCLAAITSSTTATLHYDRSQFVISVLIDMLEQKLIFIIVHSQLNTFELFEKIRTSKFVEFKDLIERFIF